MKLIIEGDWKRHDRDEGPGFWRLEGPHSNSITVWDDAPAEITVEGDEP